MPSSPTSTNNPPRNTLGNHPYSERLPHILGSLSLCFEVHLPRGLFLWEEGGEEGEGFLDGVFVGDGDVEVGFAGLRVFFHDESPISNPQSAVSL